MHSPLSISELGSTQSNSFIEKAHFYQGEYDSKNEEMIGCGLELRPDGSLYEGVRGGPGRVIHKNGDMYEGEWKNNKADGYGTFTTTDGQKYTGDWVGDRKHGKGKEVWPDGDR